MRKPKKILLSTICPYNYSDIQLALYYLKAYFIKNNNSYGESLVSIEIGSFPANEGAHTITKSILGEKPDIVGFSCYVWNIKKILKVARLIKKVNPLLKVILGGPEVAPRAEEILRKEKYIDIIVRGEGEETFAELVANLVNRKRDLSLLRGISYREEARVFSNPARPLIDNLDSIPSPYLKGIIDLKNNQTACTETARGCAYKCHYCYYHKDFDRIRHFSFERIEKELKFVLSKEPRQVYIMDATFNANARRAKRILRLFIKYNKDSTLHVELKAELLDEEMVELLYRAKANFIEIGIQSTNPKALRLINRALRKDIFKKNIGLLNRKKINFQVQLIDGLPGDTYGDLKKSLDWLLGLRPPQIIIMRLMVLPGTYLRQYAEELGIMYDPNPPYYSYKSDAISAEEIKELHKLRSALSLLYNGGLLKNTMFALKKKIRINFSDILEEWIKWRKSRHYITKVPRFIKHLCNKYADASFYEEIYPVLRDDLANFFIRIETKKRKNADIGRK